MTESKLPTQADGVWPLNPGIVAHATLDAEERAKGKGTVEAVRHEALVNIEKMLVLERLDPRAVHVVDLGLNENTDEHHMTASFHPDPTCPALLRGGRADCKVRPEHLEHTPRGIPALELRVAVPAGDDRPRLVDGDADARVEVEVYELTGFTHNPPGWIYTATSTG